MSKREARSFAAAGVDVDAPRAKRRKEAPAASPDSKQNAQANHTDEEIQESEGGFYTSLNAANVSSRDRSGRGAMTRFEDGDAF